MKPSTALAMIFMLLVSVANLLVLIFQVKVTANTVEIPMWMSVPACIVTAALAVWVFIENKKH